MSQTPPAVAVPFAISPDSAGDLAVNEADPSTIAKFRVNARSMLAQVAPIATGQAATCRIVPRGDTLYASNAGSGTLSDVNDAPGEPPPLLGTVATSSGTVDAATSSVGPKTRIGSLSMTGAVGGRASSPADPTRRTTRPGRRYHGPPGGWRRENRSPTRDRSTP